MKTYSQYYQDFFIDILLSRKLNGFFLDIGAHDGVTYSNTFKFEKFRDWKGICIEPNPSVFEKLKANRNCFFENCCISDKDGEVIFRKIIGHAEMLSGILDCFDEQHIERINIDISQNGGSYQDIVIKSKNINNILANYNVTDIDFCSLDTEGAELSIVNSIDFVKYNIRSFSIEKNNESSVKDLLIAKGYTCIGSECDNIYVKKSSIGYSKLILVYILIKSYIFCHTLYIKVHHIAYLIKQFIYRKLSAVKK